MVVLAPLFSGFVFALCPEISRCRPETPPGLPEANTHDLMTAPRPAPSTPSTPGPLEKQPSPRAIAMDRQVE